MTTPMPPTTDELAAKIKAQQEQELRLLALELNKPPLPFEPATIRKAIVTDISANTTPPTISVQMSGDTTTTIDGVRIEETYSPRVGHTVLIFKQAADIFAFGHIADLAGASAGGWTTASLTGGWSHNGNSNGNVQYRKVIDNGSWKMQWRGGCTVGGGSTVLASALASEFRPSSRRTKLLARDATDSNVVKVDFNTDGTVSLVGMSAAPSGSSGFGGGGFTSFIDPGDSTTFDTDHSHGVVGGHDHSFSGHSHSLNITVQSPTWVAFNTEYFL
ncbi:hypothetical protein [Streptomyces microflavus]|uniref:hypothetical protein n=1 Tax=Streptomyces microflavus TaxID=1919 RepID=UPI0036BAF8BF